MAEEEDGITSLSQQRLAMSSSVDLSPRTNSNEILTIENIIATLSTLLARLSEAKNSVPQCSSSNNTTGKSGSSNLNNNYSHSLNDEYLFTYRQFDKLHRDLNQIKEDFQKLNKFEHDAGGPIKKLECSLDDIFKLVLEAPNDLYPVKQVQAKLSALKKDSMKLKLNCPSLPPKMSTRNSVVRRFSWSRNGSNSMVDELPSLHMNHKFLCSSIFTEYQKVFENLNTRLKVCLLSFAVLPDDVIVKKRLMIDWWVGESLVDPPTNGKKTAEDIADEILKELEVKGFIEPVKERRKLVANRFKMQPLVHCVVIMLAQDAGFFDYHFNGIPTVNSSRCNRAFLMKDKDGTLEQVLRNSPNLDQEKVQTIFNVNEPLPDLRFEWFAKMKNVNIVEWFSRMKNVNVLYLGRWQSSGQHHIEVQSTEFLKGLKSMKRLRHLSLQGISRIDKLPDSIRKLTNLSILDLKACHNLEALPDGIASLKKLIHLDISECYLLDGMPKGLASLSELQVLKGFVIGNLKRSCTLEDLIGLKKLNKLTINTSSKAFPVEKDLIALRKLEALQKLAIAWSDYSMNQENGVLNSVSTMNSDDRRQDSGAAKPTRAPSRLSSKLVIRRDPETLELPTKLEKLELQCFPHTGTPSWLIPGKLRSLKKLYIRGGKLNNLRQIQDGNDKWTVEILRLKYLDEFNMDWNELQTSFPKLIFLETVGCDNLSSCPCDEFGVWLKP
ncbi:hypothetical protein CMV_018478 [Castanea mollissima]|uniref:Disease resistance RPP13-like protein 4 n=1 Tax=Castanea mollissima TaxID=60419 RepID=A0A8J4R0Y3_9ROSI|nr:hypothetical protein CMV_018478 [Castanea mollissima]